MELVLLIIYIISLPIVAGIAIYLVGGPDTFTDVVQILLFSIFWPIMVPGLLALFGFFALAGVVARTLERIFEQNDT